MGDYYKLKKFLLILFIIFTILRILNTSKVFGATDVNSTQSSNNYTIQTDNHFETLSDHQRNGQLKYIWRFSELLENSSYKAQAKNTLQLIKNTMFRTNPNVLIYFQDYTQTSSANNFFIMRLVPITQLNSNTNIVISGLTINSSYNFNNVPFVKFKRTSTYPNYVVNGYGGITETLTDNAETQVPIPMLGQYAPEWMEVFEKAGVVASSNEYDKILNTINSSIGTTNSRLSNIYSNINTTNTRLMDANSHLNDIYGQSYQTNNTLSNTYNYINNKNVEEITSLGFSSPDIEEKIDLNDVFDQFEALLTDENYHPKQFSFWLPNGDENVFSISPTMLEDNLTRVGGGNIIQIIHAIWFISLYGWYIFSYFVILGKLISGDWFHLVRGQSPITRMVKFSVGSITGNGGF